MKEKSYLTQALLNPISDIGIIKKNETLNDNYRYLIQPLENDNSNLESPALKAVLSLLGPAGAFIDASISATNSKYKEERLYSFLRITANKIDTFFTSDQIYKIISSSPEQYYDLFKLMADESVKNRSEEKRKRFANILMNQFIKHSDWDNVMEFTKITAQLEDVDFEVFISALSTDTCTDSNFEGKKVVTMSDSAQLEGGPSFLKLKLPNISEARLERSCAVLIRERLFHDTGIGLIDARGMEYFSITKWGEEYAKWIATPTSNND